MEGHFELQRVKRMAQKADFSCQDRKKPVKYSDDESLSNTAEEEITVYKKLDYPFNMKIVGMTIRLFSVDYFWS